MLNRIKEVVANPILIFYYVQGHINWWLHGRAITKFLIAKSKCPDCFQSNQCKLCGCPFNKVVLSGKYKKQCLKYVEESNN